MEETVKKITLLDENDNAVEFEHVLTFMYEDERYMALTPAEGADGDELELVFMHIVKDNGEDMLEPVENEILLDELFEVFCELTEDGEEQEDE